MNLPNYFLADLPPEAEIQPSMLRSACETLKQNRTRYLATRSTESLIRAFDELGRSWLDPGYSFRKLALELGPAATGFSQPVLAAGFDAFFTELTGENLEALLIQELGHGQRLNELVSSDTEHQSRRASLVRGPDLLVQIAAGRIPTPIFLGIVLGFIVRASQFIKCPSGASLLPRLFAHSIYEVEPKLGACLEIADWKGGNEALESVLFEEADCVVATGADETVASIQKRIPAKTRSLQYGHRVSFGYIVDEVFTSYGGQRVVAAAASDIIAWDQAGCLSPHVFYVEHSGRMTGERFAELLAAELTKREETEPRGPISVEEAAAITSRRRFYEVRAAHSSQTRCWFSNGSTAWTVVYEADPTFQLSCLNRFVYVKDAANLNEVLRVAEPFRSVVSTVGLAAPQLRARELALTLARWGVPRICPIGRMQRPPLTWRHDGRPTLGDLVTWSDWEQSV